MAANPDAENPREAFEKLKEYSNRCNSEYKTLLSLAGELYAGYDGLIDYAPNMVKEKKITQKEFDTAKNEHNVYKSKIHRRNKSIGKYSKKLKGYIEEFENKGMIDKELVHMINNNINLIAKNSLETVDLVNKIPTFYTVIARDKDEAEIEKIIKLAKNYIEKLMEVYIPDEMKKQPKKHQNRQQATT